MLCQISQTITLPMLSSHLWPCLQHVVSHSQLALHDSREHVLGTLFYEQGGALIVMPCHRCLPQGKQNRH